jgi:hypothetical protein
MKASQVPPERDMDFQEFLAWGRRAIEFSPQIVRLSELRIARALSSTRPAPAGDENIPVIHRCDLVRAWCEVRGLPPSLSWTAMACEGVRDALRVIFGVIAERGAVIAIPSDVYPVYWKLASQARVQAFAFETFPQFDVGRALASATEVGAEFVLLPQPLKLHGRAWTEEEMSQAERWLSSAPERRLILDGVYRLGMPVDSVTKRLISTDQVLFLDSLSKGWLHEQVFGVAIVPGSDLAVYSTLFRNLVPSRANLYLAHELLTLSPQLPHRIVEQLNSRRTEVERVLPRQVRTLPAEHGYLIAVEAAADVLLARHSLLTIPASVFGSRFRGWSIASALPVAGVTS